ncbi:MAG: hypothetical protein CL577_03755 [Alteromonadaceae bacterium]|jgi:hypothetical protein|uniref:hypothetical protein n=1 Tax=Rheinheimera aquimaris TaxID=412437 RepID=UPI000C3EDF5E|nr:hypothetical protein [Alteromonadaceae bacterium]HBN90045.1 hypothetical protein [Rheinheimera sp.]
MPLGDTALRQKIQQQVSTAYLQLGYQPQFVELPSQRRLHLLLEGDIEADLFRICQLDDTDPALQVVPVALDKLSLNAYSLSAVTLIDWRERHDLLISHIRGFKMAELQDFSGKRITVANDEQAFGLMLQGRVDIVLEDSRTAENFLDTAPETQVVWQTVADYTICHVVNQSLYPLIPALSEQLALTTEASH